MTFFSGIIEEEVQQQISSELRHGRQFRGGGSSASHQSPQELVSGRNFQSTPSLSSFIWGSAEAAACRVLCIYSSFE